MHKERRIDNRRRPTGGQVSINSLTKEAMTSGRAINLSAGGMCARIGGNLTVGDVVKLQLAMEDAQIEANSHGRIVWCEPCRDENASHVGLQLFAEDGRSNWSAADVESRLPSSLNTGCEVTLETGNTLLPGVVEHVEIPQIHGQNVIRLVVAIDMTPKTQETEEDAELTAQVNRWTTHPIRDTKQWCNRYLGPIWAILLPVLVFAWQIASKGTSWIFYKFPEHWRTAPIRGAKKLKLHIFIQKATHAASLTKTIILRLYTKARSLIAIYKRRSSV